MAFIIGKGIADLVDLPGIDKAWQAEVTQSRYVQTLWFNGFVRWTLKLLQF